MTLLNINPFKTDDLQAQSLVLNSFFESQKKDNVHVWQAGHIYHYEFNQVHYKLHFVQSFIRKSRYKNITDTFNIYEENLIGKGGYGKVYPITGKVKFGGTIPIVKPVENKVVKIQEHDDSYQPKKVVDEYNLLVQAGHIKVNNPVFSSDNKTSYLMMEKVEGFSLEALLHPVKRTKLSQPLPEIDTLKRIELSIAILKAIKAQVTDRKIIHRDIKPSNIYINFNYSPPKVTIIDYGLALKNGKQDGRKVGTRAYRSPESFKLKPIYDPKSDVYSAGRLLSYLWGDSYKNYYINQEHNYRYVRDKSTNLNLFSAPEIKLLSKDKIKIRSFLYEMMNESPEHRIDINQAIGRFSNLDTVNYTNPYIQRLNKKELNQYEQNLKQQLQDIQSKLTLLELKERDLRARGYGNTADEVKELFDILTMHTMFQASRPDPAQIASYKTFCLQNLSEAQKIPDLQKHRDVKWLIAEISSMIGLLGIGYLIAVGIKYYSSGKMGLFTQTKTDKLLDEVKDQVLKISA